MMASRNFPRVDHAAAAGELKEIYADMQATLQVAWVALDRPKAATASPFPIV